MQTDRHQDTADDAHDARRAEEADARAPEGVRGVPRTHRLAHTLPCSRRELAHLARRLGMAMDDDDDDDVSDDGEEQQQRAAGSQPTASTPPMVLSSQVC